MESNTTLHFSIKEALIAYSTTAHSSFNNIPKASFEHTNHHSRYPSFPLIQSYFANLKYTMSGLTRRQQDRELAIASGNRTHQDPSPDDHNRNWDREMQAPLYQADRRASSVSTAPPSYRGSLPRPPQYMANPHDVSKDSSMQPCMGWKQGCLVWVGPSSHRWRRRLNVFHLAYNFPGRRGGRDVRQLHCEYSADTASIVLSLKTMLTRDRCEVGS